MLDMPDNIVYYNLRSSDNDPELLFAHTYDCFIQLLVCNSIYPKYDHSIDKIHSTTNAIALGGSRLR